MKSGDIVSHRPTFSTRLLQGVSRIPRANAKGIIKRELFISMHTPYTTNWVRK